MNLRFWKDMQPGESVLWGSLLLLLIVIPLNEGGNGHIIQLVTQLIVLMGATFRSVAALRRGSVELRWHKLDFLIIGFLLWSGLSAAVSDYAYASLLELIKLASYAALFYLLRTLFPLKQSKSLIFATLLFSSAAHAVFAWGLRGFEQMPLLQAGFVNPNNFACFLVVGVNIAFSMLLFYRPSEQNASAKKAILRQIGLSVLLSGLIFTILVVRSRGAVVGLVGSALFMTTLKKRRLGVFCLIACCLAIFMPTPWGSLLQRLQKRDDPYAYQRVNIWKNSLRMASDHPIVGVGPGMYRFYGLEYNFPVTYRIGHYEKFPNIAHNDMLQIAAEFGFVGALLFVAGLGMLGYTGIAHFKKAPPDWQVAAASAVLLGIVIQGFFSTLLASPAIAIMGCCCVAILLDATGVFFHRTLVFQPGWSWYAALAVVVFYLALPVIGYPFLAHHHYLKATELREKRRIPQAVMQLRKALDYVPIHAAYHRTFGKLYLAAFRNQPGLDVFYEGVKAFELAIRCNSRDVEAYLGLANLHREMFYKKLKTTPTARNALETYRKALEYKPFDPFMMLTMATLHADLGEFDPALRLLRHAVTVEPNFVGAHQVLAKMLVHLGRHAESRQTFKQAEIIMQNHPFDARQTEYVQSLLRPYE